MKFLFKSMLRLLGLVTLADHRAACEGARRTVDHLGLIADRAEEQADKMRAERDALKAERDAAVADKFAELTASIPKLSGEEHALLKTLRERREVFTEAWGADQVAEVAALLKGHTGRLIIEEMQAGAHAKLRAAVRAAAGSECRMLGYAHGWADAAAALEQLTFNAPASREDEAKPDANA